VAQDATYFSDFIYQYINRNERWASPKFLIGESYGTTRSAMLANILQQRHQMYLNGVALLSSVGFGNFGADERTRFFLPTMITSAWYHHLLPPDLQRLTIEQIAQKAREFAHGDYAQALEKGDQLTPAEHQKIVSDVARYTGLSKEVVDQANLRIDVPKFTHYLLIDQKVRVGRLDGRYAGPDPDGLLDTPFYDPAGSETTAPFTSALNNYLRTELNYKVDMPYHVSAREEFDDKWDWGSAINGFPDTASAMRRAIAKSLSLKILVMEGYYDLATPYHAANYTMQHLDLPKKYHDNISFATYESGHMVYLASDSLKKMKADVANFMDNAGAPKP